MIIAIDSKNRNVPILASYVNYVETQSQKSKDYMIRVRIHEALKGKVKTVTAEPNRVNNLDVINSTGQMRSE